MALNYLDKAAWDAGVYKDKGNDDDTQQDTSSEDSGYSASGILSAAKNFLEHPFQGMGTVIAPNYTPRPLDDSVYSDIPGTPVASGQFGELEDESVRDERMKDSADYMAANWPRLYGGVVAADEGLANVVGGIQNAVGGGNGILTNVQRAEEGMQDYRDQWNNTYGDSYFLNPNKFATDAGSVIGSSVPIMAFSGLMPGAAVAGGTRALTSALSRAGLGRLAMSKAGQALIADTVRSIPTSNLADSLSEYGTVVNDMMQNGVSEDEARRRAIPMFFKNMALDTFTVPLELGVMKGGKGIATGLLGRGAEEGIGKSLAKGAARTGMLAGASGLTEGYQEGAQNALENDVQGKRDGGWYNPFTWTNEDWEAARGGFVGGALMGVPGNVAAGFHPEARQAPLSAESQEQAQSIKNTLSHGKPKGMSNAAYNAYIELANSGNPDLIKQAASSLESFQESQGNSSSESTDDAATEAYKDYEAYDQKQEIENFLNNNTVEQIGGEDNYNWLYGVLRNGTPEEVQKAYNDVIAAEKATAEQEAKNRPARSGGSVSPNTGNAMVNAVIQAANDSGVDPRLALAIAARESGGDDINAIHMPDPHDGIYGIMQAQDETVADLGLDSQYPDWQTDPYQNAMVGMAILKSKIANENGDVWAGVRDYNGAGEEAEQYRQLVKNNYDNMGDVGGGNSWSGGIPGYDLPTQGDDITAQVETLKPGWKQALPAIGGILNQMGLADGAAISSGGRTTSHNAEVGGAEHSYHINDDERGGGDAVDIVLPKGTTEEQAQAVLERFKATGAFKEVLFHDAGSGYHLHLGGYTGGLSSGGVSGKVTSDNGQFERELDQAAQEVKSDMDRIQAQSDQAMNEIMNDDSAEKTAQEAQEDAENAQKQAEESQQSTQDAVIPDVAQTIRDTSSNIDEINTLDGMFTKDSNGNDKFIDTPENRDYIKTNYKDEIDAAVKKAMQKTTAPKIKTQKKEDLPIVDGTSDVGPAARFMKSPHARLGNILADYDRNDPKFKGYMETFRHGTDEQQAQLADQLQQAQEQAKANSTTSNATVTTPSPANPSQQAVQAPKPAAQVNTPTPTQTAPKKAPKAQYEWGMRGYHWSGELNDKGKINIREADMSMYDSDMQFDVAKIQKAIAKAKTEEEARGIIRNIAKNTYGAHVERLRMKIGGNASVEEWRTKHKESPEIQEVYDDLTKGLTNLYEQATGKTLKEQFAEKAPTKAVEAPKEKPTTNNTETPKETPQKEKVEEKKGEVKHEENKGNNVNTKPQQAESKDTESADAEKGAESNVQEEVSKFHDLLNSKKSTPRQVVDAYKRIADAVVADAKDNPSKAKAGEKIIVDNHDLAVHSNNFTDVFIKRRLQREITAVYDNANEELRAITESAGKEETKERAVSDDTRERLHELMADDNTKPAKVAAAYIRFTKALIEDVKAGKVDAKTADKQVTDEYKAIENSRFYEYLDKAPISGAGFKRANANAHKFLRGETKEKTSGVTPYKQAVDDIMDRLDHKKLTPTQAINKLKTIMKDANAARWGEFKAMDAIESKEKLSFDDYKMALDLANDAMKKVNDMRLEASRNRKARKTAKELESATKETQNDADIRFGTVEDAEKDVMEAFGIKPHKKPADTPAVPYETSTKATPKKAVKKAVIKDNDKIEKTFHLLDDSDEALEAEKKAILEELSHLSANPAFNPVLMYHLLKVGAIHVQRGLNEFARWAKAMKDTLPQSEPFLHSVWDSLQSMPNHAKLDEKQLTAAIRYVGSLYDHGMTDKVDLRKSFIATLGVKNAKYFDAVYNAVMEYPSIEELKGANENVNRNVPELVARSGEGASENAVGESRIQGGTAMRGSRQDTAPAGKGPEEPGMGHDSVPGSSTATGRTTGNRRVQTQESKDSTGSTGSTELPGSVRAGLERVPDDDQRRPAELARVAQNRPQHEDPVNKVQEEQKDKHLNEIKKALPMLLPQQAEDVCIAEERFKEHSGMMFTNGTGTGKTYTGLGVVKRFVDAGKNNILIIAPSDGILKQWEEAAAKDFGVTLTRLDSTKDAGKGAVTATYANVGANQALVNRDFDLVITDESHNLMGSESAKPTDALQIVRAVTGHEDGFQRYHHDKHPEISSKLDELHEEIKKLRKRDSQNGKAYNETHDPSLADESREIRNQIEKLEEERSKWHKKLETFKDADEKAFAEKQPSKVLFLSATPFQYVADLDYANGYLFNYSDYGPMDEQGYNRANGRETFYMENFGYKMRYNRLERPGSDVDTDLMEREFNRKMVESGAMHGRMLSSAYDYDRGFIRVDAGISKKIDEGFDWLRDQPKYSELSDFLRGRFTGQQKYYLLEAIKAKQAIPLIKEYLKEGKKVVIFHNFNKGGADNPFAISREGMDHLERLDSELADHILEQYHEFQAERPDLADLDLNDLESPIETLSKAFGDELVLYNGTLSKGEREKNKNSFNNDDSKTKIILVQSAAGQAGVSLHDTTGNHQRALINLGLPTRPSEAIQQEGRIYRVGNKSNAIFRYLNTGTYMEQTAFATKLAERAGTVENIALGEMARSLKQAYVEAFEESQEGDSWKKYLPGSKTEGTGGKANDYRQEQATDFDRAKAVYFGKQKKNSRTKSQEGHDYFATPEPIGYKMVQWLQSKPGQSLLEPSAGDGAIARWMPDNTYNTVVEPSRDLTPKLMRNVAGAKVVESTFENFDLHNKFDGIAMNPPFGKGKDRGGKLAMEHVAKAYKHLKDGSRLIAIIPDGPACQKRFDKWFYGDPEAKRKEDRGIADGVLMADIHLPSVTFEREGTNVNTRMVVIDKYADEGTRQVAEAEARGRIDIAADDVNELFDRIEGMDMPERLDMSDEKKQTSIRKAGQQLSRSKEELKAEIKEAFPNAKEIKDEGDRMTFTMPNGSHIVVDLKNEILLTDKELAQAKKDHHIDDNGNVIVEGYAQLHGKDTYMALSQGSRENTGFHEAYHLAEGAVLTDREKAAIKKAIPDAEKRADKYAEWVEARKHGRGTAWGKLFQKINDFAAKMKKIFTGAETVNNIFRQIESGRVWERNVREQGTKQSNQPLYQAKHIVSTFADKINLNRFVNAVLTHNEKSLIMHLGKVDADEAVAIKEATGYDVSNYEHVWRSNDVRHAQKRHGIDTETASDQIGLSPEEMVDALKVISAPDKIERGSINKEGPSIRYIKADNNGQLTIVEVVRSKRKTLDIKTMWKKRAEKLHGDYALQDTSETALDATSSTTENVAHNTDNVNGEKHYSIRKPKDAADEAQEKAEQAAEDTAVTMKDILAAARKILPIYTRSKIHYNSRATYRYDEHGRAGFVPSNYTLGDIGASIALHLDHVAQLKGANVELTNDVLDELEIEQRAAKKYKQEAPKAMTPVEARREGVKEFGRIYFQDPARAKEKYPKYYDIFEKTLDGMPEEKAAVEKILELEAQRAAQNPLLLATAGLSLADDRKKPKTVKERLNTAWARFYRTMVDETDPLRQITKCIEMELGKKLADEKDPHKRAVMCNSVAEGRASMLLFADNKAANLAYLNKIYKGAIRDKVTFEDVLNTLRKVRTEDIKKAAAKDVETYFGMYLVAQRTEEIVKTHKNYVRPEGYSHENCLRIIAEAPEAIRKAAQLYWKYNRNLVNIMEAEGLISEKQAAGLRKYEKYCPMYRDMSEHRTFDDELPTITAGRGFINQSSGIKKLKGGSILAVINPIDSMVSMTTALIARCERNDVAKVMVQSAEDHPGLGRIIVKDPSLFRADASKCAFTVMIAGKKTVYRTTPELYQALQEMSTNSAAFLTNVFGKFTDALRFGATNTPSFMVRNFIRDTLSASVNARYGKFVPIVDSIRGMKALKGDADFRAKFYGQGVPMDTYIRRDIRGAKQYKDKVQKSLKRYPLGIRQLMALSRSLVHKYNDVGEALEQGTRAGAMLNALKAGASDFEAGQEARDVTVNFSRHGSFGKKVNRYVPFFNASIQGTDKVIRTFLENPKRASLATCLYIILPTIILWAINHDDDWYKELDDNTKYTNWAVHIPGTDYHWLIPKPQEVGIGFGSGVEAVLNQMLNEDPHAMKAWARQFAEVVTPGIIMTALRPVLEWRYNYSEWTGRKLVPERLSKLPPEQQYTTATSELAKLMSQFAGKYVGLSPIAIDNFFSGWFGSLGRMSANALNKPIDAIRGSSRPPEPARYWYESPFIGSFARQDGQNSVYVERFYQLAEDMEMDYKRSDSYAKNKGKKGAPIPASLKAAQTCMKTMTKINKDIRSIKDDPKMDPETKRKRIDAAYTKMRTYAKKFVTQFDK